MGTSQLDDDFSELLHQRQALKDRWNSQEWPDETAERFLAQMEDLDGKIVETSPQSMKYVVAKARCVAEIISYNGDASEIAAANSIVRDLERLRGEP